MAFVGSLVLFPVVKEILELRWEFKKCVY